MSVNADVQEIIEYLESNDLEIVKHFKNTVLEKLYTSKDSALLGILTDKFVQTKSERLLELLVAVNDSHATHLFEKLNDHLKHGSHLEVCKVLLSIIKKQPSWLHKIVGTSLFATFLKYLKQDNDISFIMSGLVILSALLPCVPAVIGSHHGDILEVFVRVASMLFNKAGSIPEVCILHLHVSVYILFHRLYAMYPNNFLSYMRSCYGGSRRKDSVFQLIIKPMFEFVKFHPDLITETPKSETSLEKWKVFQPHDVLVDCQKISLEPTDSVKEASYAIFNQNEDENKRHTKDSGLLGLNSVFSYPETSFYNTPQKERTEAAKVSAVCDHKSLINDPPSICNPSEICGMTTPPSSRPISPSNSVHDISSLHGTSKHYYDEEMRDSTQTLNELGLERKSSGETVSLNSNQSPGMKRHAMGKAKSFGSNDNVNQKSALKNWLPNSASHSTPVEKETVPVRQTAVVSRKSSSSKSQPKRPKSTEFFKHKIVKQLNLGGSDQFSVHSAPTSPMVQTAVSSQFSFNEPSEAESSAKTTDELSDSKEILYKYTSHKVSGNVSTNTENNTKSFTTEKTSNLTAGQREAISINLLNSIREMFSELCTKPYPNESQDTTELPSNLSQLHKLKSPITLLDEFIQYGSDVHSFQLSRIPLTSQLETDWTYFGGTTPVDELKILQTQVLLLQVQLSYERHKCEMHSLRNRRLFGSLQKSQALQNELSALKDHILLAEKNLNEMKCNMRLIREENRVIKHQSAIKEEEFLKKIKNLEHNNQELQYKLKNAKHKKRELKLVKEKLQKDLNKAKHHLFERTQELLTVQPKLMEIDKLSQTIELLERELLVQNEWNTKVKAHVEEFEFHRSSDYELEMKLNAHRRELEVLQEEKDTMNSTIELHKVKFHELESCITKKDKSIQEHKLEIQSIREKHKGEIKTVEERLDSTQKQCQALQTYIATLFAKLEESRNTSISTTSQSHSSRVSWDSHNCEERCRKSASYAGLQLTSTNSHCHEHSHRHSMNASYTQRHGDDNPFSRTRSHTNSISSVDDTLRKGDVTSEHQDSGIVSCGTISRSSDVISRKSENDGVTAAKEDIS